jgi:hypothetical protein
MFKPISDGSENPLLDLRGADQFEFQAATEFVRRRGGQAPRKSDVEALQARAARLRELRERGLA